MKKINYFKNICMSMKQFSRKNFKEKSKILRNNKQKSNNYYCNKYKLIMMKKKYYSKKLNKKINIM